MPRYVTREEFKKLYPKATLEDFTTGKEYLQNWQSLDEKIRLAEYWYREPVTKTIGQLTTGEIVNLDIKGALETIAKEGKEVERERKVHTHKVMFALLNGAEVLEKPREFPSKYIPIIPVVGEEEHIGEQVIRSGLIRDAKDPQRMYNYWRSTTAETISLAPKTPYLATHDQVKGNEAEWANINRRSVPYLLYNHKAGVPMPVRQDNGRWC